MEWQPIETAPKDGTVVLVFSASPDKMGVAKQTCVGTAYFGRSGFGRDDQWVAADCCDGVGTYADPTHWMRLPEPPQ